MSIEIKPDRYYLLQYFFSVPAELHPPNGGDVMGIVWREKDEPDLWHIQYRHRYREDDKVFESDDRKSWYEGVITMSEEEILDKTKQAVTLMSACSGSEPDYFMIQGDGGHYMELVRKSPPLWMHTRSVELGPDSKLTKEEMMDLSDPKSPKHERL